VGIPLVRPWMEKSDELARRRICSRYIRTFMPVAVQQQKAPFPRNCRPSVLA